MLFNSLPFILVFLPVVLAGYYVLKHLNLFRLCLWWLTLSSLFFYGWWNPNYLPLLITSILANFALGKHVAHSRFKKFLLFIGVTGNLSLIFFYKYLGFFATSASALTGSVIVVPDLILPLAISFFTFQQIAYLVEAYRSGQAERHLDYYMLFVSFFPQLIAGPIVHHKQVANQFYRIPFSKVRLEQINIGICLFVIGLAKKILIADELAPYADPVFNAADSGIELTFLEAWGGLLAYSFQLYFDFSGYADMAVGLAKLFGIDLPINFNSPYKSKNIIEFWRRWHITLSHFLRDYLYIALGGSKKGSKSINLLTTMLLGGLWHGAGWNFVIWGGLHGGYLVVNHQWIYLKNLLRSYLTSSYFSHTLAAGFSVISTDKLDSNSSPTINIGLSVSSQVSKIFSYLAGMFFTFIAVTLAWAFFRAETFNGALNIISGVVDIQELYIPEKIFNLAPGFLGLFCKASSGMAIGSFPNIGGFAIIILAAAIAFLMPNSHQIAHWISTPNSDNQYTRLHYFASSIAMVLYAVAFVCCLKSIAFAPSNEFLYFNF